MLNVVIVGLIAIRLRMRDFHYVNCFLHRFESSVSMVFNA